MIERPFDIDDHAHRKVRRVVAGESPEGELFEAVFGLACGDKIEWSTDELQELLDSLDRSNETVGQMVDRLGE
jgi:hypothetical protein